MGDIKARARRPIHHTQVDNVLFLLSDALLSTAQPSPRARLFCEVFRTCRLVCPLVLQHLAFSLLNMQSLSVSSRSSAVRFAPLRKASVQARKAQVCAVPPPKGVTEPPRSPIQPPGMLYFFALSVTRSESDLKLAQLRNAQLHAIRVQQGSLGVMRPVQTCEAHASPFLGFQCHVLDSFAR